MIKLSSTIFSTIIRLISLLVGLSIFSKSLSVESFSYLAAGLLLAQICSIFLDSGINNEIMRSARVEDPSISNARLEKSIVVRLFLTCLIFIFCLFFTIIEELPPLDTAIFLTAFSSGIIASICETLIINEKAKDNFKKEIKLITIQSILSICLPLLTYYNQWLAIPALLFPRIVTYLLATTKKQNKIFLKNSITIEKIKSYYTDLKHYSIDSIFSNLNTQADTILIAAILGKEVYALYQPISKMYLSTLGFAGAIGSYFIPLATTHDDDYKKLKILTLSFGFFSLASGLLFYILTQEIVKLFFSEEFIPTSETTLLIAAIISLKYLCAGFGSFLTIIGRQKQRATVSLITTAALIIKSAALDSTLHQILTTVLLSQIAILACYSTLSFKALQNHLEK